MKKLILILLLIFIGCQDNAPANTPLVQSTTQSIFANNYSYDEYRNKTINSITSTETSAIISFTDGTTLTFYSYYKRKLRVKK